MYSNKLVRLFSVMILLASVTSRAQAPANATEVQELRKQLDEMRKQMGAMESKIEALESSTANVAVAPAPATPVVPQEASIQTAQPLTPGPVSKDVGEQTRSYQTFSENPLAAARMDNVPLDPKYRGYFVLPGTRTMLKIGGYFKTDFIYDFKPAGNPEQFIPSSIPIPAPQDVNNETVSVRPTRLTLDFLIPNSKVGDVRFYLEGDFFGTNATTPRLRHAYGQAKNFLIGQTFTNFMDPDAFPDTLDFAGPNALVNLRNPQFSYGFLLGKSTTLHISVERPSSDIAFTTPAFTAQPNSPSPDGVIRIRREFPASHVQAAVLLRSDSASVGTGANTRTDSVFGWGVSATTGFRTFGKDNMILQGTYGNGIARYIQDTSGLGVDAAVISTANPRLRATPEVAFEGAYQHYWANSVRSSVAYGFVQIENTDAQQANTFHKSDYSAANLIWNPGGSLNLGAEFLYGWQILKNGQTGNAPRIQFSAKYNFVNLGPAPKK